MKRLWLACFAVAAATSMIGTANAQWNQSPEIGSYQSILSRTGYGAPQGSSTRAAMPQGSSTRASVPGALPGQLNEMPTQIVAPSSVVAPVTSYAPQTSSFVPQATSTCNGNCGSGGGGAIISGGSAIVSGGGSYGAPMVSAVGSAPVYGGATPCSTGNCGGGGGGIVSGGSYGGGGIVSGGSYTDLGPDYSSGSCGGPVYTPGANIGNVGGIVADASAGGGVNRVGGVFGVVMRRNYADPVRIGSNAGAAIFSNDIDHGDITGIGASIAARKANGNGREFVYWGLDEDTDIDFTSPDFVSIRQLEDLQLGGDTVLSYFNTANSLRVYRDTEINNIEANLLRNGGSYDTRRGKSGNFELLGGLRLFQFDESLRLVASGAAGTNEYRLEADNFLIGAQLGARNEVCLTQRLRLSTGINVGLFNNRSETRQRVFDQDGTNATVIGGPANGRDFDYSDTQDDLAIMGEFRVGLIMQVSERLRANAGYRALGVGGVALAEDQIPLNALDPGELLRSNTNGNLLLHGFYFGGEACF